MTYNPKLAAGNPQDTGEALFGQQQLRQLAARTSFSSEVSNLQKLNESNAQFWKEQHEKSKR